MGHLHTCVLSALMNTCYVTTSIKYNLYNLEYKSGQDGFFSFNDVEGTDLILCM